MGQMFEFDLGCMLATARDAALAQQFTGDPADWLDRHHLPEPIVFASPCAEAIVRLHAGHAVEIAFRIIAGSLEQALERAWAQLRHQTPPLALNSLRYAPLAI